MSKTVKKKLSREDYIPRLFQLFRQYGYDGASLAKMSEATGLGKASLYHHFPGGKDEMVEAVLDFLENRLKQHIIQNLQQPGDASVRLQRMVDYLQDAYDRGQQPCVIAILLLGSARDVFHTQVRKLLQTWIEAISSLLIEAGISEEIACQRAEEALIAIQGSLVLSQGLDKPSLFQRKVQSLPTMLLEEDR